jgi:tetratricopeptide (TPR) repeat protein
MFAGFRSRLAAASFTLCIGMPWAGPPPCRALVADSGAEGTAAAELSLAPAAGRRVEVMAHVAAAALAEESDPAQSEKHKRRALDLDPANITVAQGLATIHLGRGEVPEALAVLKDALSKNPKSSNLALRIASIYVVKLRKFDSAERYAKQAWRAAPDSIDPYQTLYSIYRANGRRAEADAILEQAARRKDNQDAEFWAGLGDLRELHDRGQTTGEAAPDPAPALAHYRRAVELGRQDAAVLLRAHNYFFAYGHLEDAVASAQRLMVLQPSDTLTRERLAFALNALGRQEEALAELERVVADNPASAAAYREHGRILLERGDYAGALQKFEKVLLLNDEDPRLYLQLVELCLKSGNDERAVWWLSQARGKFARLPDFPYYEGQVLAKMKRWNEALLAYDMAADLAAKYQPSFVSAEFHFQHGVTAERAGDRAGAENHFRACLALDDQFSPALNYLGYMWAEKGQNLAEAEEFIRRALEQEPENAAYLDSLGWVLYQQGRYQEALSHLERAMAHSADDPDPTVHEHLGDLYDKLGRRAEAIASWERAMALQGFSEGLPAKLQAARGHLPAETNEAKAAP